MTTELFYNILGMMLVLSMLPFVLLMLAIGFVSLFKIRSSLKENTKKQRRFCIVIPAHNEQSSIEATLDSLQKIEYPQDCFVIVVIADNCSDQTANISRSKGVVVVERFHETKKSKGYALEHFFEIKEKLGLKTIDGFVVVDADSEVDANILKVFNGYLEKGFSWLQAYYTVRNPEDHWRAGLMKYALSLFNGIWLLGQEQLGLGAALRGNGMCFSADGLRRFPWQAYGLTEDLEFAWRLRLIGEKVAFVPETKVYGEIVVGNSQGVTSQRQRWEHGRGQLKGLFTKDIIRCGHFSPLAKAVALADLWMLPLSRYVGGLLALGGWGAIGLWLERSQEMLMGCWALCLVGFLALGLYGILPSLRLGMPLKDLKPLAYAPFYMVWKLFVALQPKSQGWVRTPRNTEKDPKRKAS